VGIFRFKNRMILFLFPRMFDFESKLINYITVSRYLSGAFALFAFLHKTIVGRSIGYYGHR